MEQLLVLAVPPVAPADGVDSLSAGPCNQSWPCPFIVRWQSLIIAARVLFRL